MGYMLTVCCRLIFPQLIRFQLGSLSFSIYDFYLPFLVISFFLHKNSREYSLNGLPSKLSKFLLIFYLPSLILILFSSYKMPISLQFGYFAKTLLLELPYIVLGYYAMSKIDLRIFARFLYSIAICVGIYGIWVYLKGLNPYISIAQIVYNSEQDFLYFLTETRGGLTGRTSGTMVHPLTWGQMWNILIAFYLITRNFYNNRIAELCLILLGLANIILCGSRTSIVCLLLLVPFIIISYKIKIKELFKYIPLILVVFIIVTIFIDDSLYDYIKSGIYFWDESYSNKVDIKGSSVNMRIEQFENSWNYSINNEIGGLGYNSIFHFGSSNIGKDMYGFESIVFRKLYEQGIIGLLVFFLSYYVYYKFILSYIYSKRFQLLVSCYFFTYLVSICFTGIQDTWILFIILPLSLCKLRTKLF